MLTELTTELSILCLSKHTRLPYSLNTEVPEEGAEEVRRTGWRARLVQESTMQCPRDALRREEERQRRESLQCPMGVMTGLGGKCERGRPAEE